jgi:hypothetical protein
VTVESGDLQEVLRLHQDAHKKCFIANSVNFPVLLEPAVPAYLEGIGPFGQLLWRSRNVLDKCRAGAKMPGMRGGAKSPLLCLDVHVRNSPEF